MKEASSLAVQNWCYCFHQYSIDQSKAYVLCLVTSVVSGSMRPHGLWPDTPVHGLPQARIPKWVAMPPSWGSFQPRNQTQVFCLACGFFTIWATRKPMNTEVGSLSLLQGVFWTQELNSSSCIAAGFFTSRATKGAPK